MLYSSKLYKVVRFCHTSPNPKENLRSTWKNVIGLEIHAQLQTKSKLFSPSPVNHRAPTNDAVALFDAAIPGTLPTLNKKAVELAVATALAFGCKINPISYFDRKHYFYSDLPAGYQITQQRLPIAENGKVNYAVYQCGVHKKPYYKTSFIKQIQLEQDSGKSLHESSERQCYIDLNRAGVALVEIVFQPDVNDEYEAIGLVKEVIKILERVGSCSCKMEEGALRVDANVSVHKDQSKLGVRTEIKNLGSITAVGHAIKYELSRQVKVLDAGGFVKNETLAWDSDVNKTKSTRDKEEKQDYRFMPEPNLPPLRLLLDECDKSYHKNAKTKGFVYDLTHLRQNGVILPEDDRKLLTEKYALNDVYTYNLVNQNELLIYFKEIMAGDSSRDPKLVYLLLMIQLLGALNENKKDLKNCSISSTQLGELVDLLQSQKISKSTGAHLIKLLINSDSAFSPNEFVSENNLYIITDAEEIKKFCLIVIEEERDTVALYKLKKTKKLAFNELVDTALKKSNQRADTKVLAKVMSEALEKLNTAS